MFIKKDSSISQEHFDEAISSLIEKGLVEKLTINNHIQYRLTTIGMYIGNHINSNPDLRN